jgi:hypothetical protein
MARLLARTFLTRALFAGALFAGACAPAYADRIAAPPARPLVPIAVAPEAVRSPYAVEIVADDGDTLDTFFHKGRYYVRGAANRAYTIRVSNPTPHRIEAVVSVDGLDVIDGESGDLRKRGYIVPPMARSGSRAGAPRSRTSPRSGSRRSAPATPVARARPATSGSSRSPCSPRKPRR